MPQFLRNGTISMKKKIELLRNKVLSADDRTVFIERYRFIKEGYQKFKDEPAEIRNARITAEILANISLVIDRDNLIVGDVLETIPTDEEEKLLDVLWDIEPEILPPPLFSYASRPEVFNKIYSEEKTPFGPYASLPAPTFYSTGGHTIPDWEGLLQRGMRGIKIEAKKKLTQINTTANKQKRFLEAVIICSDAVIAYAQRYVKALDKRINNENNEEQLKRLKKAKKALERVPANPATSFHQALQSIWILDLILHQVIGARDFALGRADQYLYPFYKSDIESGMITREKALTLIQELFIKLNAVTSIVSHMHGAPIFNFSQKRETKRSLCLDSIQYCTIGGQKLDGSDASNEVSFLILDAVDQLRLKQPALVLRHFAGQNDILWKKACDAAGRGLNNIVFYNDEVVIPAYETCGILRKDAVEYAQIACNHPGIPGRTMEMREYWFNLPKHLELTLNNGYDPMIDRQMGRQTGKIANFASFFDFFQAFQYQMEFQIDRAISELGEFYKRYFAIKPFSFESVIMKDCVEMAMDYKDFRRNPPTGTGYIFVDCLIGGLATTADSLAVIKKIVFDDKIMSLTKLNSILLDNFEHHENLRLELLHGFPKYGNDDDFVDLLAVDIARFFAETVSSRKNPYVGFCLPSIYTYHSNACHGAVTGATADGRKAGDIVSENQQATNGMDKKGPTALLNSMAKLKPAFLYTPGGGSTLTLHPTVFSGSSGTGILSDLILTYFKKGGQHVQTNVVNKETLIEAQQHPEKYQDLVVRVTGYSAYFVTLSPESQDNLIERIAHLN
jgi:pyruvate-formate lyase